MKIKRVFTQYIVSILSPHRITLKPALSRARNRFYNLCLSDWTQFEKDRNEIIMHYVPKDDEGNPIWSDGKEGFFNPSDISEDQKEKFDADVQSLLDEDFIFEDNEKNQSVIVALKIILRDIDITFKSPEEELFYDEFCNLLDIDLDESLDAFIGKISNK
jgi:hypothetical protein